MVCNIEIIIAKQLQIHEVPTTVLVYLNEKTNFSKQFKHPIKPDIFDMFDIYTYDEMLILKHEFLFLLFRHILINKVGTKKNP